MLHVSLKLGSWNRCRQLVGEIDGDADGVLLGERLGFAVGRIVGKLVGAVQPLQVTVHMLPATPLQRPFKLWQVAKFIMSLKSGRKKC